MNRILYIGLFLLSGLAQAQQQQSLLCEFQSPYFRVFEAGKKIEKFITSSNDALVECGEQVAAVVASPYFAVYADGKIVEKFITSTTVAQLKVGVQVAVAVMPPYFVGSDMNGTIKEKFITSSPGNVPLAVSETFGVAFMTPYFVGYGGGEIREKFITSGEAKQIVAGHKYGAVLVTPYIAVFDVARSEIKEKFVGGNGGGRLAVKGDFVSYIDENGRITSYNGQTGQFQ